MIDHDQRFKEMLRVFLFEFLSLFFPPLLQRWDVKQAAWQTQELFTNPPLGLVRRADLIALAPAHGTTHPGVVLHLEAESAEALTDVRRKIAYYYPLIRTHHNLPVISLALYLRVGLQGTGWDVYTETDSADTEEEPTEVFGVRWRYVGLPQLRAEEYLGGDNWLGVALAALMRIEPERKVWLRAEILRRLAVECLESDYRKLLLINCVETYLPLEGEQQSQFLRLMQLDPRYREITAMIQTTYDKGKAEGKTEGKAEGLQDMILKLAERRCGKPDAATLDRLRAFTDLPRLQDLVERAFSATSWAELLSDAGTSGSEVSTA